MKENVKIIVNKNIFVLSDAGEEISRFQNFVGLSFEHVT